MEALEAWSEISSNLISQQNNGADFFFNYTQLLTFSD